MDKKYFYILGVISMLPISFFGLLNFFFITIIGSLAGDGSLVGLYFLLAPIFSITALFYIKNRIEMAGILFMISSICGLIFMVLVDVVRWKFFIGIHDITSINLISLTFIVTSLLLFSLGITVFRPVVGKTLMELVFALAIIYSIYAYSFVKSPIIGIIFVTSVLLLLATKCVSFLKRIKEKNAGHQI